MYSVNEPSAFDLMPGSIGELIRYRLIGFSISNCVLPSYMVTDQNAFTGGGCPAGEGGGYWWFGRSRASPAASVVAIGYTAPAAPLPRVSPLAAAGRRPPTPP